VPTAGWKEVLISQEENSGQHRRSSRPWQRKALASPINGVGCRSKSPNDVPSWCPSTTATLPLCNDGNTLQFGQTEGGRTSAPMCGNRRTPLNQTSVPGEQPALSQASPPSKSDPAVQTFGKAYLPSYGCQDAKRLTGAAQCNIGDSPKKIFQWLHPQVPNHFTSSPAILPLAACDRPGSPYKTGEPAPERAHGHSPIVPPSSPMKIAVVGSLQSIPCGLELVFGTKSVEATGGSGSKVRTGPITKRRDCRKWSLKTVVIMPVGS
jgi:hypothetical protein